MNGTPPSLRNILQPARLKHVPKGQIILYEGDISHEAYIIKSGVVKLYDIDTNGNEKILHLVSAPAAIPFALFRHKHQPLQWFYTALTDCEVYVLPYEDFEAALQKDNALQRTLVGNFAEEVHELLVRLSSLGKTSVRDKLIAVLRFLLVRFSEERRGGWCRVTFPISHQLLADIAGVTRESTAIVMKELQKEKVIRNPRLMSLEINKASLEDL